MRKRRRNPKEKPSRMSLGTSHLNNPNGNSKDIDFETRKKVFEEIKRFNRTELEELYKILRRSSEEVSENRNGMFFDLLSIKNATIEKIQELIKFCIENRADFEVREKVMSQLIDSAV
jgi:hypothetical protein